MIGICNSAELAASTRTTGPQVCKCLETPKRRLNFCSRQSSFTLNFPYLTCCPEPEFITIFSVPKLWNCLVAKRFAIKLCLRCVNVVRKTASLLHDFSAKGGPIWTPTTKNQFSHESHRNYEKYCRGCWLALASSSQRIATPPG